ncbi:MAG: DUF2292 domain-containing protein [Patescibacteria group bacterium]
MNKEKIKELATQVEDSKIYDAVKKIRSCGYGKVEVKFYAGKVCQIDTSESVKVDVNSKKT